ncbi:MAG TPA: xanthine dehydrogenase family protein subunit M [Tepidisphaeraceae bacterium]|nr:xanthine dehydrogenase family protein subunit M [Tepidisphaeraceae bacterium]
MQPFTYEKATDQAAAARAVAAEKTAKYLAGGTTLVDLMKLYVETPTKLVDIKRLPMAEIRREADGSISIGAGVTNSAVAYHELVQKEYAVLSQAILAGASTQIRNVATVGGNLLQRTRCPYFRDGISNCNKRTPGSGCDMATGFNRTAAVLGTSDRCVATYPGDMAIALLSLDAVVHVATDQATRKIAIDDFFLLPGNTPEKETSLSHGEIITAVSLPRIDGGTKQGYVKVRDRASYEFALASAAAVLWMDGGTITQARISLGGVASKPWRAKETEAMLAGKKPDSALFREAAAASLKAATPMKYNAFKPELATRAIERVLTELTQAA